MYFDGNPMGWDRHELQWNGMGWDKKNVPWTSLHNTDWFAIQNLDDNLRIVKGLILDGKPKRKATSESEDLGLLGMPCHNFSLTRTVVSCMGFKLLLILPPEDAVRHQIVLVTGTTVIDLI